jgi:hypothetical protein
LQASAAARRREREKFRSSGVFMGCAGGQALA